MAVGDVGSRQSHNGANCLSVYMEKHVIKVNYIKQYMKTNTKRKKKKKKSIM